MGGFTNGQPRDGCTEGTASFWAWSPSVNPACSWVKGDSTRREGQMPGHTILKGNKVKIYKPVPSLVDPHHPFLCPYSAKAQVTHL